MTVKQDAKAAADAYVAQRLTELARQGYPLVSVGSVSLSDLLQATFQAGWGRGERAGYRAGQEAIRTVIREAIFGGAPVGHHEVEIVVPTISMDETKRTLLEWEKKCRDDPELAAWWKRRADAARQAEPKAR